mgnify:FL=1|tara:strand:+ start:40358 stop:41137 length:780 start_codon:yes stop_codon:yes gene_type:complete
MRYVKYLSILLLVLSACKTNKIVTDSTSIKEIPSRKIVKNHLANRFNANTLDSKIRVQYTNHRGDQRKRHSFTVRMRIKKDSVIWMRGSKLVTAFKIKITPNSFSYYSPLSKEYFEGDFALLKRVLGVEVNFSQLQDLLVGKSIFDMKGKRFQSEIEGGSYKLTPKTQEKLFNVFFKINPSHYKLNQLYLVNEEKNQSLKIDYYGYTKLEEDYIPTKVRINAMEGERYTYIDMRYSSLTLNKPVNVSYKVPSGYKRIEL